MADRTEVHEVSLEQARAGLGLQTDRSHRLVVRRPQLIVRLLIDPSTPPSGQRFTLIGGHDLASSEYTQTLTADDDLIKGDDYMDLRFTKLKPGLKYWLEVDPGTGDRNHMAFEAIPWVQIKSD